LRFAVSDHFGDRGEGDGIRLFLVGHFNPLLIGDHFIGVGEVEATPHRAISYRCPACSAKNKNTQQVFMLWLLLRKQRYTVKIAPLASMKGSIKIAAWSLR
jgi:hypothetical protein